MPLNKARQLITGFQTLSENWAAMVERGKYPLEAKGSGIKRIGVTGEMLNLAFEINEAKEKLDGSTTPTKGEFKAALNSQLMDDLEEYRVSRVDEQTKAARKLIKHLRSDAFIDAWIASSSFEQVEIVSLVGDVAPLLDVYDPRDTLPGATQSSETDRYLSDAAMGRRSIFSASHMLAMLDAIPVEFDPDGTPKFNQTVPPSLINRITGQVAQDGMLKWVIAAQARTAGLMTVVTNHPNQFDAFASVMMKVYGNLLPGLGEDLAAIKNAADAKAKLKELDRILDNGGWDAGAVTNAQKLSKAIDLVGIPLGYIDGLTKITGALTKIQAASNPEEEALAQASVFGEATKLMVNAYSQLGNKAAKTLGSKVLAVVSVPMLALELVATYKNISKATRSGDLSVAFGESLLGIAAIGSTALGLYSAFAVGAAAGGPAGLAVAVAAGVILAITLVGLYLITFTIDSKLETFAFCCAFGRGFTDWSKENPGAVQFGFTGEEKDKAIVMDCAMMSEKLFSLRTSVGFAADSSISDRFKFELKHARMDASTNASKFPTKARTRCDYIGNPPTRPQNTKLPGFDDQVFRTKGGVQILFADPGSTSSNEVDRDWMGKWVRLEVSYSTDNRLKKTIEYAQIPVF